MKKTIKHLAFALLTSCMLVGCSNEEMEDVTTPPVGEAGDITFNIAIENDTKTRTTTDADFKTTFVNGDAIGLFAVSHASGTPTTLASSGNAIHNVKLTYNATTQQWTPATPLHYSGAEMDFYAYYPYNAAATNPTSITFNVLADQSTEVNYNKSDLLSANAVNIANGTTTVDLTFKHKLALVQVEVDNGTIKGSGPTAELALTLRGCMASGAFNLASSSLATTGNATAVKMLRVEKSTDINYDTKYTYRALVPAQTVAQNTSLCLMTQAGMLSSTPKLTATLPLVAGDAKLYTAALPATAIQTVKIKAGTFQMGSPTTEPNRDSDEKQHSVTLTKDYYMGKYQVTNAQYAAFLNAESIGSDGKWAQGNYPNEMLIKPSSGSYDWGLHYNTDKWEPVLGYENHPIIYVTWYGAKAYCDWLSAQTGGTWSLPTEAQWEYACRGDYTNKATETNTMPFGIGDGKKLTGDMANFDGIYAYDYDNGGAQSLNSSGIYLAKTARVGSYKANSYGLYDMHGNVYEWCFDNYRSNYEILSEDDPLNPPLGNSYRVLRGGYWDYYAQNCRSAFRNYNFPAIAYNFFGFRVVFVP